MRSILNVFDNSVLKSLSGSLIAIVAPKGWSCLTQFLHLGSHSQFLIDVLTVCSVLLSLTIQDFAGAHHVDLRFSTAKDPKWLQDVRKREVRIISGWLQQYYDDCKSLSDP